MPSNAPVVQESPISADWAGVWVNLAMLLAACGAAYFAYRSMKASQTQAEEAVRMSHLAREQATADQALRVAETKEAAERWQAQRKDMEARYRLAQEQWNAQKAEMDREAAQAAEQWNLAQRQWEEAQQSNLREQADQVAVWVDPGNSHPDGVVKVFAANSSPLPVFDVVICAFRAGQDLDRPDDGPHLLYLLGEGWLPLPVLPGRAGQPESNTTMLKASSPMYRGQGELHQLWMVAYSFRDAAGNHWKRAETGRLELITARQHKEYKRAVNDHLAWVASAM